MKFNKNKIAKYVLKVLRFIGYLAFGVYIVTMFKYGLDRLLIVGVWLGLILGLISNYTLKNAFVED